MRKLNRYTPPFYSFPMKMFMTDKRRKSAGCNLHSALFFAFFHINRVIHAS